MLHPLPKNRVSTLAFTTHPPRCCEDHARLVADKLANGKDGQKKPGGLRPKIARNSYRDGAPLLASEICQRYVRRSEVCQRISERISDAQDARELATSSRRLDGVPSARAAGPDVGR
jgi:hypothetical protein